MPTAPSSVHEKPTIVCLHYLGGSHRSWTWVVEQSSAWRILALDLPGFGERPGAAGFSVAAMTDDVANRIGGQVRGPWLLVGHSMGGKVAAALARRAEGGEPRLAGLRGIVQLAASPPAPEPMDEARRSAMLGWFQTGDHAGQARRYVAQNAARPLPPAVADLAAADVLRMDRAAWAAWLTSGSREDWSATIGVLQTPALLVAGAADADLGPAAQRALSAPHYARCRLVTLPDTGHLLPLERPLEVAQLVAEQACAA